MMYAIFLPRKTWSLAGTVAPWHSALPSVCKALAMIPKGPRQNNKTVHHVHCVANVRPLITTEQQEQVS